MLQSILTGQAKASILLGLGLGLFLYLLPSVLSFLQQQKRFWTVLVLNLLLTFVQSLIFSTFAKTGIFQKLFPGVLAAPPSNLTDSIVVSLLVGFGPGWLVLLFWVLRPGEKDARLDKIQQSKFYDVIAGLPLMLWFGYGAFQLRPVLAHHGAMIAAGTAPLFIWVQFVSLLMVAAFDLLLVYLLMVRDKAKGKSKGVLPRFFGFLGTFMGLGILQLPVAVLSLPMQILAAAMIGVGSLGSFLVLWRLGKSFSILPEARKLVTGGPYAWARHPLYSVEMITVLGTALQFQAPWAWVIALVVVLLLWIRSHYEEQVLAENFPEYNAYRARTKRFIPKVL